MSESFVLIKKQRPLRDGEALCKYNFKTIINTKDGADGSEGHCGMCHPLAIQARELRVAPLLLAAQEKSESIAKERAARLAAKSDAELEVATRPSAPAPTPLRKAK